MSFEHIRIPTQEEIDNLGHNNLEVFDPTIEKVEDSHTDENGDVYTHTIGYSPPLEDDM